MTIISELKFTDPVVHKGPLRQANATDNSTIGHSDTTPEFVYDYLSKADEVCSSVRQWRTFLNKTVAPRAPRAPRSSARHF